MYEIVRTFEGIFDSVSAIIIIIISILSLLIDGRKYNKENYRKEYKIVKIISYFYIAFGIFAFVVLSIG